MIIGMVVAGFLFWFIIVVLNLASMRFGYEIFSDLNSDAKLQKVSSDPRKFKIGNVLALIEHLSIISLAVTLFIAFNSYNLVLAVIWTICRIGEGSIQIYNKRKYLGLLNIAGQYSGSSGTEKQALVDLGYNVLKTKNSIFSLAQVLFSIGTLAYSTLFVFYEVLPEIIGWFGIIASILYGFGNGLRLGKPNFKVLWNIGGLLIWLFEIILGGWLLLSPLIFT